MAYKALHSLREPLSICWSHFVRHFLHSSHMSSDSSPQTHIHFLRKNFPSYPPTPISLPLLKTSNINHIFPLQHLPHLFVLLFECLSPPQHCKLYEKKGHVFLLVLCCVPSANPVPTEWALKYLDVYCNSLAYFMNSRIWSLSHSDLVHYMKFYYYSDILFYTQMRV